MDGDGSGRMSDVSVLSVSDQVSVSCGGDETNPDLLKNTASNIRRLEDEIEQYEGRYKYHAQTHSPFDGSDVRWYFCKVPLKPNELAAAVPSTEVVGKGEYFRFGMRDSLAIEASFLQQEEELLSYWWKEYAECSEGPKGQPSSTSVADLLSISPSELYTVEEDRVGVPVKGGLYEVDLVKRHCFPVYWNGENRRVLRGHWFAQSGGLDWLPLREDIAEQLEFAYHRQVWHRRTFQPSGLFAARVDLQGSTPGLHALFMGEDDTWEAWLNVDASGFSSVINFGGNGIKLRRGYAASPSPKPTQDELRQQKEEDMDDYCSQVPVRHLVFMVHGIGQRLEKSNLVDDVSTFRLITSMLAEKHLTSYQRDTQRVLFIPCQWRKGLKLSGESAVESITLDGVRGLRTMLSATVHDVLYYMSPIYCQDIIDSVSNQLNCLFVKFLKRNPGYDGKVSLYGHSLGSVLSYDILCHQENLSSPFPMDMMYRKNDRGNKSSSNTSKSSSEHDFKTDVTEASQEASDDMKSRRRHVPSNFGHEQTKDSQLISDNGPTFPYFQEKNANEERDSESQIGLSFSQENDRVSDPGHMVSPGIGALDDVGVRGDGVMGDSKEKISSDDVTQLDVSEKVAEAKHSSDTTDKDKNVADLKSEIDFLKARIAELEQTGTYDARGKAHNVNHEMNRGTSAQEQTRIDLAGQVGSHKSYKAFIKYTKLKFKVHTFFAVGSPLGVFLALRNVRIGIGKGKEYWEGSNIIEEMPACQRMFNIFHPFDPVAHRVEPLVCKEYVIRRPVIVPYHKGGKRLHIGLQEFKEDLAARSKLVMNHFSSVRDKVLMVCQSRKGDKFDEGADAILEEVRSYGSYMMERLTGSEEGRIDHALQDKTFQHPYISAIGSHTNYWRDYDTALFILKHLYQDIPQGPKEPIVDRNVSKDRSLSTGWLDTRGFNEEDLPLTFSDPMLIGTCSDGKPPRHGELFWEKL